MVALGTTTYNYWSYQNIIKLFVVFGIYNYKIFSSSSLPYNLFNFIPGPLKLRMPIIYVRNDFPVQWTNYLKPEDNAASVVDSVDM